MFLFARFRLLVAILFHTTARSTDIRIWIINMNGLVKHFSPGVVVIFIADSDQVRTDCEAGDIQINRGNGFDFRIKRTVLCRKVRFRFLLPGRYPQNILPQRFWWNWHPQTSHPSRGRKRKARLCGKDASKNLFHGGSGGFNGDGASDGYGEGIGGEADRDGAIGGGSIGQIIPSPAWSNIIS